MVLSKLNNLLIIGLLSLACSAFAEGPFGKSVTGKSLLLGVDDCSSTKLIDNAIEESGINFVDGSTREVFGCEQLKEKDLYSNGGSLESYCRDGKRVRCYADGSRISVCVANPRGVAIDKEYGDAGKTVDHRARFEALFVFSKDGAGYGKEKSWKMDANGCNPTSAYLGRPIDSEDQCRSFLRSFASGGTIYSPNISEEKFCDGKISSNKLGAIPKLSDCLESYPQLKYMDREKSRTNRSSNGRPAQSSRAVQ